MEIEKSIVDFEKTIPELTENDIFCYSQDEYNNFLDKKPWRSQAKISLLALMKMLHHTKTGGDLEVMGLMQGRVHGDTFIICDSFAAPVQGTETRVNAGVEANEYISQYFISSEEGGRQEYMCGWYHSHPSYGCWLSGIDVGTQFLYQKQDPWLAIVIDPIRTMTSGKLEIGAFRTYPENYSPPGEVQVENQAIPLEKIEDFGVHYQKYYSLEISFFKTKNDVKVLQEIWSKFWATELTSNSLFESKEYYEKRAEDVYKKVMKDFNELKKGYMNTSEKINEVMGAYLLEKNRTLMQESIKSLIFM